MSADLDSLWAALIPNERERARWQRLFGPDLDRATELHAHFTDPVAAARWKDTWVLADLAAHLDRHGVPASEPLVSAALTLAADEASDGREILTRTAMILAHPTLTRDDRDAVAAAGLTLPEIDALVTAGPIDRDALIVLGALQ